MLGLLAVLPRLKDGHQADYVAMTPESPELGETSGKAVRPIGGGMKCLLAAPWGRLMLGDDPVPVVLLLIFALLLLPPLLGVGLGVLMLASVGLLRAWLWCARRDKNAQ